MDRYEPQTVEARWQRHWDDRGWSAVPATKDPFYLLEMFPYPSGRIHMGHVRNYTIGDVLARFLRACGHDVLHPMGWDAFGLPAETAAIQRGIPPARWTRDNIDTMREQLRRMGFSYDWRRELATCEPDYYRWEQRFFQQMVERDLAYRKSARVNWCDECGTVLANEQVEGDECWRGHRPVRKKELDQWFFRITAYADELLADLAKLEGWPEKVRTMQHNWIGRSEGVEIEFSIDGEDEPLTVFTTRADTLLGATFLSLAPEHEAARRLGVRGGRAEEVDAFVERIARQDPVERAAGKEGVFTGCYAVHPIDGRPVPVYLANFVVTDYGTGAVMAVPAHDQRDFEFARAYEIDVRTVVAPEAGPLVAESMTEAFEGEGVLHDSGQFDGLASAEARAAIAAWLDERGRGRTVTNYRLRDWGISRQRYWGTPIPMIHCADCGVVPVPAEDLPVVLPTDVDLLEGGRSPLADLSDWVEVDCPRCGGAARRDTDTMDTFVESSWYFLRYTSTDETERPFDPDALARWLPVAQYIGGVEHAVLHLLYARFYTKVLRDLGYHDVSEPFANLLTQGMVIKDGAKMSKSKGNVVDPDELVSRYGADTARLFSVFAAPPEKDLDWSDRGVEGASRFLLRTWRLVLEVAEGREVGFDDPGADGLAPDGKALRALTHETIQRVTRDIGERLHFNTAVAAIMELANGMQERRQSGAVPDAVGDFAATTLVRLLSPFAPHAAAELWDRAVGEPALESMPWPQADASALERDEVELVVQVNGKVRARVTVASDADEGAVLAAARAEPKVAALIAERTEKKAVVVPGRLVNLVVG